MGGSIHIHKTGSSIIDTVFVCRTTGSVKRRWLAETPQEIAALVLDELGSLRLGGVRGTLGDARCIAFGHLVRLTIWELARRWRPGAGWTEKLEEVAETAEKLSGSGEVERLLEARVTRRTRADADEIRERAAVYDSQDDEVPFSTSASRSAQARRRQARNGHRGRVGRRPSRRW
jgi:hypothetical protein